MANGGMRTDLKYFVDLPIAIVGAFFVAGLGSEFLASLVTDWTLPFVAPSTAAAVVGVTFLVAPQNKIRWCALTLVVGGIIAWIALGDVGYPESHPRAYQRTLIPFAAAITGGVASFTIGAYLHYRLSHRGFK